MNQQEMINKSPKFPYTVKMQLPDGQIQEFGFHHLDEAVLVARDNFDLNEEFLEYYDQNWQRYTTAS